MSLTVNSLGRFAPLLVFGAIALGLGFALTNDPRKMPSQLIDRPAPKFTLPPVEPGSSGLTNEDLGGKVALLGIPPPNTVIDWNQVIFKGLEIKGVYGREMFETWYKMVAMIQSGLDLTPIITHHYAAEEFETAFATMLSGQSGKIILDWAA